MNKEKFNLQSHITGLICDQLDKGVIPWVRPWEAGDHQNPISGSVYTGINPMLLDIATAAQGFNSNLWLTFKQAKQIGANVKKGSTGNMVVYWNVHESKTKIDENGRPESYAFLKYYRLFNLDQIENFPADKLPAKDPEKQTTNAERIATADAIFEGYNKPPGLKHAGSRAYYAPAADDVTIPEKTSFYSDSGYYHTLFHELSHSTGHRARLNRPGFDLEKMDNSRTTYSKEELIADIGASMLCKHAQINPEIENTAAYCAGWSKAIRGSDAKTLIIGAASAANKSTNHILGKDGK